MSERRGQEDRCDRCGGEKKRPRRPKHLYLVLDDWDKGFTIYKVDAEDGLGSNGDHDPDVAGRLPEPPALRLQSPWAYADMFFTAVGAKIFTVTDRRHGQTPALVYYTSTGALASGPRAPPHLHLGLNIVVPAAGGALYAFSSPRYNKGGSFEAMSWAPASLDRPELDEEAWSWRALPALPPPLVDHQEIITSYAVHPDGRTVFMTTSYRDRPSLAKSTYSFDTGRCEWRWYPWELPFRGRGHFDLELDAWVGLHRDGYVCSCRVPSDDDGGSTTPISLDRNPTRLDCQMVKKKMFRRDQDRHLTVSLTYMGDTKFCLLESVIQQGVDAEDYCLGEPDGSVLHMTIFRLKYNHKGELQPATSHHSSRSYLVSKHKDCSFAPVAFWM